jgi:sulfite exporter TauE/SafE
MRRPLLYHLGRVASYTVLGGIIGGLGSVLSVGTAFKGVIMLGAGLFMVLMSLSMLGWLPARLVPRLPAKWTAGAERAKAGRGPFVVGLLNGLMPCGPLQAMQLYALSTGTVAMGALSMFLFSVGTVPLMLGSGLVAVSLKGRFTRGTTRVSAVLVMLIAVVMVVNATGFFGWSPAAAAEKPTGAAPSSDAAGYAVVDGHAVAKMADGYQEVAVDVQRSAYPPILVQKGVPVRFHLLAQKKDLNGCNGTVVFPSFGLEKKLAPGDNLVEFTPDATGTIAFSCWMSMIHSSIVVVDDLSAYSGDVPDESAATAPPSGGSASADGPGGMTCCG